MIDPTINPQKMEVKKLPSRPNSILYIPPYSTFFLSSILSSLFYPRIIFLCSFSPTPDIIGIYPSLFFSPLLFFSLFFCSLFYLSAQLFSLLLSSILLSPLLFSPHLFFSSLQCRCTQTSSQEEGSWNHLESARSSTAVRNRRSPCTDWTPPSSNWTTSWYVPLKRWTE